MNMMFTTAGHLNRWGLPARTNISISNSRLVKRKAYHRTNNNLLAKPPVVSPPPPPAPLPAVVIEDYGFTSPTSNPVARPTGLPTYIHSLGTQNYNITFDPSTKTVTRNGTLTTRTGCSYGKDKPHPCDCASHNDWSSIVVYKVTSLSDGTEEISQYMRRAFDNSISYGYHDFAVGTWELLMQQGSACGGRQNSNRIRITINAI